jgi:competence protein ComEC
MFQTAAFSARMEALLRFAKALTNPHRVTLYITQVRAALRTALVQEYEYLTPFVWLPVAFGIGILAYFQRETEPSLWMGLVPILTLSALIWRLPPDAVIKRMILIALIMMSAGFFSATFRTWSVASPLLSRTLIGPLTGYVESVEVREKGPRLLIRIDAFAGLPENQRPLRTRVSARKNVEVKAGDYIYATARLMPLPEAPRPGGYDFGRDAFFKGYGSVGSLLGQVSQLDVPHTIPWDSRFSAWVDRGRNALTKRISDAYGGQEGAVTAALVTGKRGLINEDTNDDLRGAGIYHIISISGLHMVLAAGAIFGSLRAFFALFPFLALGWPIKKIAAIGAMLGATAYCVFSGSDVATERSLIMTLVIFGAIVVDRPALSLRNLALSALIVLIREPESILSPSFQMSFAAVAGLMAFAVHYQQHTQDQGEKRGLVVLGWIKRIAHFMLWTAIGLFVTTVIATLATAPFSIYHFQTVNPLGLIGNALALPFISIIVMPGAVAGVVLYPLGWDAPVWWVMGVAVRYVLEISAAISSIEGASTVVPALTGGALLCFVIAILMATLFKTFLRWGAVVPLVVGLMMSASTPVWDVMIDREARGAAVRGVDGRLVLMGKPSDFVADQWLKADGDNRYTDEESLKKGITCDALGCVTTLRNGQTLAYVRSREAFFEDCARADVIVSMLYAPEFCPPHKVFDGKRLPKTGAVALSFDREGRLKVVSTRSEQANLTPRPWMRPLPVPKAQQSKRDTLFSPPPPPTPSHEGNGEGEIQSE